MVFASANALRERNRIVIRDPLLALLGQTIPELSIGAFIIIESDMLRPIHQAAHTLMIDTFIQRMHMQYVDVANAFNPHLLEVFNRDVMLDNVLKNITLSRPFQHFQSLSILNTLISNLLETAITNQFVLVTGLDSQIAENENEMDVLQQLIHILGGLQNIAVKGNIVFITNQLQEKYRKLFSAYATIHMVVAEDGNILFKHPFTLTEIDM